MKAVYEQIPSESGESILFKIISLPLFDAPFHFHPEYELTFIVRGSGSRYVGMNAEPFYAGDLILLGPNLPHCWINYPEEDGSDVKAYVVQFSENMLKDSVLKWPEFQPVSKTYEAVCRRGCLPELLRRSTCLTFYIEHRLPGESSNSLTCCCCWPIHRSEP